MSIGCGGSIENRQPVIPETAPPIAAHALSTTATPEENAESGEKAIGAIVVSSVKLHDRKSGIKPLSLVSLSGPFLDLDG